MKYLVYKHAVRSKRRKHCGRMCSHLTWSPTRIILRAPSTSPGSTLNSKTMDTRRIFLKASSPCFPCLAPTPPSSYQNWGSNLEAALYNRIVRLLIHCNNEVNFEEGYLLFTVGDFDFSRTCANYPDICAGSAFGDISQATADNFCRTWMCMAFVLVAVGMASVLVY